MTTPNESDFVRKMSMLSLEEREAFIDSLPRERRNRIRWCWELWARPEQLWRPGTEMHTVYLAGRRWGKSRSGAEAVRYVAKHPELCGGQIGIAGRTANDVNETMLYGPSGLMNISPPNERPRHYESKRKLVWRNGVVARLFSGQEPDGFRGPGFGFLWADELPHWLRLKESWENALYALSLGTKVRSVITTTPIGVETLERIVWDFDPNTGAPRVADGRTPAERVLQGYVVHPSARIVSGSSYENLANLAENYKEGVLADRELGLTADQEIRGMILRDVAGAIFKRTWRHAQDENPNDIDQVVVAIDPSGGLTDANAEVGMVVLALSIYGIVYVLEDASGRMDPQTCGERAWAMVDKWGADAVVAEKNYGGQWVPSALKAARPRLSTRAIVKTFDATRDKATRFSLIVPAYQSGRIVFCGDSRSWVHLDRQAFGWDPSKPKGAQPSPDRLDAFVWGVLYLIGDGTDRMRPAAFTKAMREAAAELEARRGGTSGGSGTRAMIAA